MRLWHPSLFQELPGSKLGALHMALCRIRQKPWGKPTPRAWYYNLAWDALVWYHSLVIREMQGRFWRPDIRWLDYSYRGKSEPILVKPGTHDYEANHMKEIEAIMPEGVDRQTEELHRVTSLAIIAKESEYDDSAIQ